MSDGWQPPPEGYPPQVPPVPPQAPPVPPQYPSQPPQVPAAGPPAGPPAAPPAVPTPAPKKSPKLVLGLSIGCGLLLCACVSAALMVSTLSTCSSPTPWTLSHDQQRVMKEFGPPQGFSVAFASDVATATTKGQDPPLIRLETWRYPALGSQFTFRDGSFLGRAKIEAPKVALQTPALRPDAFVAGMSPAQVSKIVDAKPDKSAAVLPDMFKDLKVQSYRGQVIAGYQDDKLVVIQVIPVTAEGSAK